MKEHRTPIKLNSIDLINDINANYDPGEWQVSFVPDTSEEDALGELFNDGRCISGNSIVACTVVLIALHYDDYHAPFTPWCMVEDSHGIVFDIYDL